MGDSPTTVNPTATVVNKLLYAMIYDVAVGAAEAEIYAVLPFLKFPGLNFITEALVKWVAGYIYVSLARGATFAIIDAQTSKEAAEVNTAKDAFAKAIEGGNPDAIQKAKKDFEAAFGRLVHLDGSAPT